MILTLENDFNSGVLWEMILTLGHSGETILTLGHSGETILTLGHSGKEDFNFSNFKPKRFLLM